MNKTEHLLTCLIEECSEIQHAAAKALRFGLDDHAPDGPVITNQDCIATECADLLAVIEMLEDEGIIPRLRTPESMHKKKDKVEEYMRYAIARGTMIDITQV